MPIKNDLVLDYIESLPEGEKVSVRELAAKLQVSEGTAYKAVKRAEQFGLVMVKPKVGTVRVCMGQPAFEQTVSLADTVRLLGLNVLTGRQKLGQSIRKLVICDGSEQSMLQQLDGVDPAECLCLCGDRPEMQTAVLEHGANLLLTGGAKSSWVHTNMAERKGLLILSSPQSAYSLIRLFDAEFIEQRNPSDGIDVTAWMQTPDYLYYNDVVADWQRLFIESSLPKEYPVVDDNLELFGSLDIWNAATAIPSQKLRSVIADTPRLETVQAEERLKDVARRFIINGDSIAAVLDGRRMLGIITSNDLLRYYLGKEGEPGERSADSFLTKDIAGSTRDAVVFHVRVPDPAGQNDGQLALSLLIAAAASHLRQLGCEQWRLESGTYIAPKPLVFSDSLILLSRIQPGSPGVHVIEAELSDDNVSYAKMMMIAADAVKNRED